MPHNNIGQENELLLVIVIIGECDQIIVINKYIFISTSDAVTDIRVEG